MVFNDMFVGSPLTVTTREQPTVAVIDRLLNVVRTTMPNDSFIKRFDRGDDAKALSYGSNFSKSYATSHTLDFGYKDTDHGYPLRPIFRHKYAAGLPAIHDLVTETALTIVKALSYGYPPKCFYAARRPRVTLDRRAYFAETPREYAAELPMIQPNLREKKKPSLSCKFK